MPTDKGLRVYVDGLLEIGALEDEEKKRIQAECRAAGQSMEKIYDRATTLLSGLSSYASLVIAPKANKPIKQIQFVFLEPGKILAVLVLQDGLVENRIMGVSHDITPSNLQMAANYLNERLAGKTLAQAHQAIQIDMETRQSALDDVTTRLVKQGLALPIENDSGTHLVIRGQSRLLNDVQAMEDLDRARILMEQLEEHGNMLKFLDSVDDAKGVQIYIGAENKIFDQTGWSMIVSPYKNSEERIIGAIGVIGPTSLNYGRIVPMVDYTAKIMTRLIDQF